MIPHQALSLRRRPRGRRRANGNRRPSDRCWPVLGRLSLVVSVPAVSAIPLKRRYEVLWCLPGACHEVPGTDQLTVRCIPLCGRRRLKISSPEAIEDPGDRAGILFEARSFSHVAAEQIDLYFRIQQAHNLFGCGGISDAGGVPAEKLGAGERQIIVNSLQKPLDRTMVKTLTVLPGVAFRPNRTC